MEREAKDEVAIEKSRVLTDSSEFMDAMATKWGIPNKIPCPDCGTTLVSPNGKQNYSEAYEMAYIEGYGRSSYGGNYNRSQGGSSRGRSGYTDMYCPSCKTEPYKEDWQRDGGSGNILMSLLGSIQYYFKERVLKLSDLAKAFAKDPRNNEELSQGLDFIMEDHDFDTSLEEVKDRISKYKPSFGKAINQYLTEILGYDFMGKDYKPQIKEAAMWMLHESRPGQSSVIHSKNGQEFEMSQYRDFNDDLWYAAMHAEDIAWPKYDIVLADEVQDFNEAQKIMLKKLAQQGARVVAVGDPNQAIYRFRGGDAEAFQSLATSVADWSQNKEGAVKGITRNFRSKPNLLKFAEEETGIKGLVSGKQWADDDQGDVTKYELQYDEAMGTIGQERAKGNKIETAFIARTNEPLLHAALSLLTQGVPFVIIGKDIAKDLIKHIRTIFKKYKLGEATPAQTFQYKLNDYIQGEQSAFGTKSTKKAYLAELKEVTEALLAALETFQNEVAGGTVGDFKKWLDTKLMSHALEFEEGDEKKIEADLATYEAYMEEEKPVVLTTSHRSKGLEFDRVYILRYDQFPHPRALKKGLPKDLAQENNMKYVALTRGKNEMHVLDLNGQPGYKPPKALEEWLKDINGLF